MRALLNLSLFAVAAGTVFAATLTLEEVPAFYAPKLEALAPSREKVDTLYFGSSRLYRGVMPEVVDRELARLGHARHSFNMAMIAMRPHEADRYLRALLADPPPALRTVVIELGDWTPVIRPPNRYTPRPIFWHDAHQTRSVIRSAWLLDAPLGERLGTAWMHALHFGARGAGLGRIPERVRSALAGPDPERAEEARVLAAGRGFRAFPPDDAVGGVASVNRRAFLADPEGFRDEVAALSIANALPGDLAHYNVAALRDQVAAVEGAGLELLYIVAPGIDPSARQRQLAREGLVPVLFAFDEPESYPALYEARNRFDRRHLNTRGAKRWSTLLARRLADHWDGS